MQEENAESIEARDESPASELLLHDQDVEHICSQLGDASSDFEDYFEEQRIHYGIYGQRGRSEVVSETKRAAMLLGKGREEDAQLVYEDCVTAFRNLSDSEKVNIPTVDAWTFESDAGQELTELRDVLEHYPVLRGRKPISAVNFSNWSFDKLGVTRQSWLSGIADGASEIVKLTEALIYNVVQEEREQLEMAELCVKIVDAKEIFLHRFAKAYPLIVSASRRRFEGFSQKRRMVQFAKLRAMQMARELRFRVKVLDSIGR